MPTVYVIFLSAGITVGYVQTSVNVFENSGVATLTVAISVPPRADPIETSFYLLVNTMDGSATAGGLAEFDCVPIHFANNQSLTIAWVQSSCVTHTHIQTHTP